MSEPGTNQRPVYFHFDLRFAITIPLAAIGLNTFSSLALRTALGMLLSSWAGGFFAIVLLIIAAHVVECARP